MQNNNVSDDLIVQNTVSCFDDSTDLDTPLIDEQCVTKMSLADILFAYCKNKYVVGVQRIVMRPDFGDIVNLKDKNGRNALFYACWTHNLSEFVKFNNLGYEKERINRATYLANSIKILQLLLDAGCDANSQCDSGENIIHNLCQLPHRPHLDYILNAQTMMQMICERDGANININLQNKMGRTPLHRACSSKNTILIEQLLRYEANVMLADKYEWTAFDLCESHYDFDILVTTLWLNIVVKKNRDKINIQNDRKNTMLHRACFHAQFKVAELLVNNGCDTTLVNSSGKTAIDYCIEDSRCPVKLVELIKSKSL
jgi:ankyrin repeat protein